jgi:hypothetical protein
MTTTVKNRKLSIPISTPLSLLADIDRLRGDVPRSVFVCKILAKKIAKSKKKCDKKCRPLRTILFRSSLY